MPAPYSVKSTLAPLLRGAFVVTGILYGSWKLGSLRAHKKVAEQKALAMTMQH
jgi:hypothetical protein